MTHRAPSPRTALRPLTARPGHAALRRGRVTVPHGVYLVSAATRDRCPHFSDFHVAAAAARCFQDRPVLRDALMLAWVLMPDHAHWLLQLGPTTALGDCVGRIKSASARAANRAARREGAVWSPAYHDHGLRSDEHLVAAARYVVANPLRAGLVERLGDYPFWSAVWF